MGWADFLGPDNAFQQFVAGNRGKLGQLGAGLASGQNFSQGLANGVQGLPQGQATDDAFATAQKADTERQRQLNSTIEFMRQKGYGDLVSGVEGGGLDLGTAWGEALKRSAPQKVDPFTLGAGDIRYDGGGNVIARGAPDQQTAPSGYMRTGDGNLTYIPGGPADPSTPAKTTEATRRNQQLSSMIGPELQTVEQNWEELSSGANQAANSAPFGAGYGLTSPGYQQATNALGTIAQSYLYSVSGAAAPAEEVRKLVESVTPRPFEDPKSIADKKARVRQMAAAVQEAAGGVSVPQQATPGGQTSSGLSWSIVP